jgi:hypothetical protein
MGSWKILTKFWMEKLKGRDSLEGVSVCEDNIKTGLKETRMKVVDWINLTQVASFCKD